MPLWDLGHIRRGKWKGSQRWDKAPRGGIPRLAQSSIWEALDLNSWKEDQNALGSSLPASGLLKVARGQVKKWPLDTILPQGHSFSTPKAEVSQRENCDTLG